MASIYSVLKSLKSQAEGQLIFPTGFIETGHEKYIKFTPVKMNKIYDQVKEQALKDQDAKAQFSYSHSPVGTTITLPIPTNLSDTYDYSFGGQSLGQIAGNLNAQLSNSTSLTNALSNATTGLAIGAIGNAAEAAGQGSTFSTFFGVMNPYLKNNFQGVDFKTHNFNFILVPRNQQDAIMAKKIVENFKIFSAPFGINEPILDVKYFWEVSFSEPQSKFLYNIHNCALQNLQISYNTMGLSGWHDDGSPIDIQISMTLTELDIASGERIQNDYDAYKDSLKLKLIGG